MERGEEGGKGGRSVGTRRREEGGGRRDRTRKKSLIPQ